jgi:hypothetical protein
MFETLKVIRSERPAMCPQCKTPKFAFVRTSRGTICVPCADKPLPHVTHADVEHSTRELGGVIMRHGKPCICIGCEKDRSIFSLKTGLCVACSK